MGEPERTVTRHGSGLLKSGHVIVTAVPTPAQQLLVACESGLGTSRLVGEALARRGDAAFVYATSGTSSVLAEVSHSNDLDDLLTVQLPATPGLNRFTAYSVLKPFKRLRDWRCGALTPAEELALTNPAEAHRNDAVHSEYPSPADGPLIEALRKDGRIGTEELARRTRMSTTSVIRRIRWLLKSGQLSICTLVEPALLGFAEEAVLWVKAPPEHLEELGHHLQRRPEVRHASAITGEYQLFVNIAATSQAHLYALLSHSMWSQKTLHIHTDTVVTARKRGGRLMPR
ncbi:Lrp/AsnC family transcriptional regulator [Leucobacter insecticola]|uniref:Lrp/AsnC family transcriptional regulator n=1 Tax=Leucobacter insecticola TaxID=2714934 RepID=UPI001FCC2DBE|nr:Lrp/AsnC family transcriptional regulator [Leucobacter insecticola]